MGSLLAFLLFLNFGPSGPVREINPEREACKVWWSQTENKCRDEDVENLGSFDARPGVGEWSHNAWQAPPKERGEYSLEKPAPPSF